MLSYERQCWLVCLYAQARVRIPALYQHRSSPVLALGGHVLSCLVRFTDSTHTLGFMWEQVRLDQEVKRRQLAPGKASLCRHGA